MVLDLNNKNIFPLGAQQPAIPRNWGLNQESAGQATFLSCCHFLAVGTQPAFCHHLHLYKATEQMWERLRKDSISQYYLAYLHKSYLRAGKQSNVPVVPRGTHGGRSTKTNGHTHWISVTHAEYWCTVCTTPGLCSQILPDPLVLMQGMRDDSQSAGSHADQV